MNKKEREAARLRNQALRDDVQAGLEVWGALVSLVVRERPELIEGFKAIHRVLAVLADKEARAKEGQARGGAASLKVTPEKLAETAGIAKQLARAFEIGVTPGTLSRALAKSKKNA